MRLFIFIVSMVTSAKRRSEAKVRCGWCCDVSYNFFLGNTFVNDTVCKGLNNKKVLKILKIKSISLAQAVTS